MNLLNLLRPRRIGVKLFLVFTPLILVLSFVIAIIGPNQNKRQALAAVADKSVSISGMIAYSLGPALYFEDLPTVQEVILSAEQNKDLAYIVVLDASGKEVASFQKDRAPELYPLLLKNGRISSDGKLYQQVVPIAYKDKEIGRLYLGLSLAGVLQQIEAIRNRLIAVGSAIFVLGIAAVLFMSFLITGPLWRVSETAKKIAQGDMSLRAQVQTFDEVGHLAMAFNSMVDALKEAQETLEHRVEDRTRELRDEVDGRKRVEEALRESEERFRSMMENLGEGVGVVSAEEDFLFANKAVELLFGVPPGGLVGKNVRDFTSAESFVVIRTQTERRQRGERSSYELEIVRPDGTLRTAFLTSIPRFGPKGDFLGTLTVIMDITDRKKAERELREANERLRGTVGDLEQRNVEIGWLSELFDAFQACRDEKEIYDTTSRFAGKLFPGDEGVLYIYKESRNLLDPAASWGERRMERDFIVPEDCWALRRGKLHLADEPGSSLICPHVTAEGELVHPYVCIPLMARGTTIGLLHIAFRGQLKLHGAYVERLKVGLSQSFSERIALALDNLRLRETLRQQSLHDPLTGLFNRRYMETTLDREMARSKRNGASLGVITMDIDKFKDFNDTFGHEAGDAMLKVLGGFLQSPVRKEDIVCRYGGEEFIIILPGASLKVAAARARKLCEEIKPLTAEYGSNRLGPISLSLGVAAFPDHGSTWAEVVQAADLALLRAKKEGRARVIIAGD